MATFAIVRADGSVDKVEGASVEDVSNRYGAPGNGSIEAWDEGSHGSKVNNTFATPEAHHDYYNTRADSESMFGKSKSEIKAAAAEAAEGDS